MSRTFVISAEAGLLIGILIAFYLVPGSTPARTFWSIAGLFIAGANGLMIMSAVRARKRLIGK